MVLDFMASLEAKFGDRSIPVVTSIIATELGHLLQTAAWPYILICVNRCLQIMLENKGYQPVQLASLRAAAGVVDMQARKEGTTH